MGRVYSSLAQEGARKMQDLTLADLIAGRTMTDLTTDYDGSSIAGKDFNQSIKTNFYSAIRRERIRGAENQRLDYYDGPK